MASSKNEASYTSTGPLSDHKTRERVQRDQAPVKTAGKQGAPNVVDVRRAGQQIAEGVFRIHQQFVQGAIYVDSLNNRRIGSIGRNVFDGRIEAAVDARYSGDINWECLFDG